MQTRLAWHSRLPMMAFLVLVAACALPGHAAADFSVRASARVNVCPPRTTLPAPCFQESDSGRQETEATASMSLVGSDGRIGEARARADLSSGSLGVFAMAQGPNELFDFNGAEANANLTETVFLHVSPTITGNFTARLQISATGSISGEDVNFRAQSGSVVQIEVHTRDFLGRDRLIAVFERGLNDAPFVDIVNIPIVRGLFADPANPFFTVSTSLIIGQSGPILNATADFFGTATLALQLPDGVTFTSESGRFLAAVPSGGHAPVADVGADLTVAEATAVTLDGTQSFDPEGSALTYRWAQVAGITVALSGDTGSMPTFNAPMVDGNAAVLTFQLIVNDGATDSAPATVNVTVQNVNQPPVADAGAPQIVQEGTTVSLSGAASFDPDDDALTFVWTQDDGIIAPLSAAASATPTFTAPLVGAAGSALTFRLRVTDPGGLEAEDTVEVTITNVNQRPVAVAGSDQTRNEGAVVMLDGTLSSDPDGDAVGYQWTQLSGPPVTLNNSTSATPGFTAPMVGGTSALRFQLVVNDGRLASEPALTTVTVVDTNRPVACGAAVASPSILWPPNHKLMPVAIRGVTDDDNDPVTTVVTGVTQDEPVPGPWEHGARPDAVILGNTVLLRAETSGRNGRVYQIRFSASDGRGATCDGSVLVGVPLSMKPGQAIIDDGQRYDSTREPRRDGEREQGQGTDR